jgi:hypothetical protein
MVVRGKKAFKLNHGNGTARHPVNLGFRVQSASQLNQPHVHLDFCCARFIAGLNHIEIHNHAEIQPPFPATPNRSFIG